MEGDKTVTQRLKRLAPALRDPAVQLILKLALANHDRPALRRTPRGQARPPAPRVQQPPQAGARSRGRLRRPARRRAPHKRVVPQAPGRRAQPRAEPGQLAYRAADAVHRRHGGLELAAGRHHQQGWQYVRPILVYTGAIATIVLLWIGASAGISRLKNERPG